MLTKELRDAWIKALTSGQYQQAKQFLQYKGKFCCLGVLCEVAQIPSRKSKSEPGAVNYKVVSHDGNGKIKQWTSSRIPESIAGLDHFWCQHLSSMNDTGSDFAEIAEFIEDGIPFQSKPESTK